MAGYPWDDPQSETPVPPAPIPYPAPQEPRGELVQSWEQMGVAPVPRPAQVRVENDPITGRPQVVSEGGLTRSQWDQVRASGLPVAVGGGAGTENIGRANITYGQDAPGDPGAYAPQPFISKEDYDLIPDTVTHGQSSRTTVLPLTTPEEAASLFARLRKSGEAATAANERISRIREALHQNTSAIEGARMSAIRERMSEVSAREAILNARADAQMKENMALLAEIKNTKIEPSKRNNILDAIAMALGAFGSALTRTPNAAMQIIQDAKDRDMKQQIASLTQKRAALAAGGDILAGIYRMKGDLRESVEMYRIIQSDIARAGISSLTSAAGSLEQKPLADILNAQNERDRINAENKLYELTRARVSKTSGGSSGPNPLKQAILMESLRQAGREQLMAMKGPGRGAAKEAPTDAKNKTIGGLDTLKALDTLELLLPKLNPIGVPRALQGEATRQFMAMQQPLKNNYIKLMTGANSSPPEVRDRYDPLFIKGTNILGIFGTERGRQEQKNKLDALRQSTLSSLSTVVKMYPTEAEKVRRVDPQLYMRLMLHQPATSAKVK